MPAKQVDNTELISLINSRSVGKYRSTCPVHGGDNPTSLSVEIKADPPHVLAYCFAHKCAWQDIHRELVNMGADLNGHDPRDKKPIPLPTGTPYEYPNPNGKLLFVVVRQDTDKGKKITQYTPARDGLYWPKGYTGKRPLYRVNEITPGKKVLIVEGEKCVEAVKGAYPKASVVTWSSGAGNWRLTDWTPLAGLECVLVSDADEEGRKAMTDIAGFLHDQKATVKLYLVPGETHEDVADWLKTSSWKEVVDRILENATDYNPSVHESTTYQEKTSHTLRKVLNREKIEMRYNTRAEYLETRTDGGAWEPLDQNFRTRTREHIRLNYSYVTSEGKESPLAYGRDDYKDLVHMLAAERQEDPFILWLESLPVWDEKRRLKTFLSELFDVAGKELDLWTARYLFLAPIARAYEPGVFIKQLPILIGPQNTGKSQLLSQLFPDDMRGKWFGDQLNLWTGQKARAESLQHKVIVEFGELAGLRATELAGAKAFFSSLDDGGIRLSYRADPKPLPRKCSIVGTSDNLVDPLPYDAAGHSRFVICRFHKGGDVEKYMAANRDQLWAEAIELHKEGSTPKLSRNLYDEQARINREYTIRAQ